MLAFGKFWDFGADDGVRGAFLLGSGPQRDPGLPSQKRRELSLREDPAEYRQIDVPILRVRLLLVENRKIHTVARDQVECLWIL